MKRVLNSTGIAMLFTTLTTVLGTGVLLFARVPVFVIFGLLTVLAISLATVVLPQAMLGTDKEEAMTKLNEILCECRSWVCGEGDCRHLAEEGAAPA